MLSLFELIDAVPKAELHMHIEGSLEPEMIINLAKRNGMAPPWPDVHSARRAFQFANLREFLDVFYSGLAVLRQRDDFRDVTWAYLEKAHADNIVHAELFLSPQAHLGRGINLDTMLGGVFDAFEEAQDRFKMSVQLMLLFQRHLPEEKAIEVFEQVVASKWNDRILAFGLAGAELPNPPGAFREVFARCRDRGYHVVAHAGEEGPANYIRDALDLLKIERVDHGVTADQDEELVRRLASDQIPLTVCPMANVKLGVFKSLADHNLARLMEKGLLVSIHTDDPSYFEAYMNDLLKECARQLGLDKQQILELVSNGFRAAFLPESEKTAFIHQVDSFN